jgi:hypothetical protein
MTNLSNGEFVITQEFAVGSQQVEFVALLTGMSVYEISLWLDTHIFRSNN